MEDGRAGFEATKFWYLCVPTLIESLPYGISIRVLEQQSGDRIRMFGCDMFLITIANSFFIGHGCVYRRVEDPDNIVLPISLAAEMRRADRILSKGYDDIMCKYAQRLLTKDYAATAAKTKEGITFKVTSKSWSQAIEIDDADLEDPIALVGKILWRVRMVEQGRLSDHLYNMGYGEIAHRRHIQRILSRNSHGHTSPSGMALTMSDALKSHAVAIAPYLRLFHNAQGYWLSSGRRPGASGFFLTTSQKEAEVLGVMRSQRKAIESYFANSIVYEDGDYAVTKRPVRSKRKKGKSHGRKRLLYNDEYSLR
jgi:hypothetical protein